MTQRNGLVAVTVSSLVAVMIASSAAVFAQSDPVEQERLALNAGSLVRGNVVEISDRSLSIMDPETQQTLSFRRDQVSRVDVLTGRRSHFLLGGIVGAGFGAVLGALETPGCEGNDGDCYTRGENIGYSALGFGLVGALIGALIKTDEWAEVPLPPVAVAQAPRGRGIRAGFVVAAWN